MTPKSVTVCVFIDLPLEITWIRRDGSIVVVETRTAPVEKKE